MQKLIDIQGIEQPVVLIRRKGRRNMRIALKSEGKIQVSVPYGIPEMAARVFIKSKIDWINKNLKPVKLFPMQTHIGKSHRLNVVRSTATRSSTKITDTDITVRLPEQTEVHSAEAQKIIRKACEKALLLEATNLLPQRLKHISDKTGIEYASCNVKKLKSRWGSCDNKKNITLNSYLIQLDWELIDYVIYHELSHTHHAHHQKEFWDFVSKICPNYKTLRKELKSKPTDIIIG